MAALPGQADLHQFYYIKVHHDSVLKGPAHPAVGGTPLSNRIDAC
jgi:hypothetical protein